jgi:hypothetical protein
MPGTRRALQYESKGGLTANVQSGLILVALIALIGVLSSLLFM